MNKPKLESTKNYDLFEMHDTNRPIKDKPLLLESMQKNGFIPSGAIHCYRNGNGKLKIIRGHHRFHYAQRLKLAVYYIIDDTNHDIFNLEGDTTQAWSSLDFLKARAKAGNKDCDRLLGFMEKHHIPIGPATSLMVGQSANSRGVSEVKRGTFKVGDMGFANEVIGVIDILRDLGVSFATSAMFLSAMSLCLRIPELDIELLREKIKTHYLILRKRLSRSEYLEEIENVYNYKSQLSRLPIKFRALEIARERQKNFGQQKKEMVKNLEN